jgi:hypothetical protein
MVIAIVAIAFVAFTFGMLVSGRSLAGDPIPRSVSIGFWFMVGLAAFTVAEGLS